MPKLVALRQLCGDYGVVHPGQTFETDDASAESLKSRGLAEPWRDPSLFDRIFKSVQPIENKAIAPNENKNVVAVQVMPNPPQVNRERRHQSGRR